MEYSELLAPEISLYTVLWLCLGCAPHAHRELLAFGIIRGDVLTTLVVVVVVRLGS